MQLGLRWVFAWFLGGCTQKTRRVFFWCVPGYPNPGLISTYRDITCKLLSELARFCAKYDEEYLAVFFGSRCSYCTVFCGSCWNVQYWSAFQPSWLRLRGNSQAGVYRQRLLLGLVDTWHGLVLLRSVANSSVLLHFVRGNRQEFVGDMTGRFPDCLRR